MITALYSFGKEIMDKLNIFGKLISEELRDSALNHYLDIESKWLKSERAKKLSEKLDEFSEEQKQTIRQLLTQSIDVGIHDFLFALEEGREDIKIIIDGDNVAELSDGLQAEPYTSDGWYEKYSQHKEEGI